MTAIVEDDSIFLEIDKEMIPLLSFPKEDVLPIDKRSKRLIHLERAMKAGNNDHVKFDILFEDTTGHKKVCTTIWGVTNDKILLKQNMTIPIRSIWSVLLAE